MNQRTAPKITRTTTAQDRRETLENDLRLQADMMLRLTMDIQIANIRKQSSIVTTIVETEVPKYIGRLKQVWSNIRTYQLPSFFDRFPDAGLADYFTAAQTLLETAKVKSPIPEEPLMEPWNWN
jgi:hypothetical protein